MVDANWSMPTRGRDSRGGIEGALGYDQASEVGDLHVCELHEGLGRAVINHKST